MVTAIEALAAATQHLAAGRPAEAEQALRTALQLQPDLAPAHTTLGGLLQAQGRLAEAAEQFRHVVAAEPGSANAQFDLGGVLHRQGTMTDAASHYERALALDPHHVPSHVNLGIIRKQQGALDEAVRHFRQALAVEPKHAAALTNLGTAYELQGLTDQALAAHDAALEADPTSNAARHNRGTLLQKLGRLDEALACFEQVLRANPRYVQAWFGIASVRHKQGDLEAALTACRQALAIDPTNAKAHLNMGTMLNERGRRDEAIVELRRAIELDANLPSAHGNLAIALHLTGHIDEAIAEYRREIAVNPRSALHHSNLLYCLNFHPTLDAEAIFAEHRAWAARHADPLTASAAPHVLDRSPDRRLRVGYVSPYFYDHAVNFFVEPILAAHDHGFFEVFCYSDAAREDEATARLRGHADAWRTIRGQGHEQVARLIRDDRIDILVDLTGHIGENRLLAFARKPAPVQVTYIGYQNTTGMQAMDYRLTDAYADPPGLTDRYYTERLVRLPTTFFVYRPSADACDVSPLPAHERGYVTFGSFNNFAKVTRAVLAAWAEILAAVPHSRLVVLATMTPSLERHVRDALAGRGIEQARLKLVNHLPRPDYFRLIAGVDVALDPFPFQGHTTTCDCIWQGVPVVTLLGRSYASRFGASGLHTLGLDELVADSPEAYRRIAIDLAGDLDRLSHLRATLRQRMTASPLLDFSGFTRNVEAAYRRMWRDYCAG
jgi:predicted O-linked N-acetylglucosamine transferase (SPINDLY family)